MDPSQHPTRIPYINGSSHQGAIKKKAAVSKGPTAAAVPQVPPPSVTTAKFSATITPQKRPSTTESVVRLLKVLREKGKTDIQHGFIDPSLHELQTADAPPEAKQAFQQLMQKAPVYACVFQFAGQEMRYRLQKTSASLAVWIQNYASHHGIKLHSYYKGASLTQVLTPKWSKDRLATEFPQHASSITSLDISSPNRAKGKEELHFECIDQRNADQLMKAHQLNWVFEHFRLPEFVVNGQKGSSQSCKGLEALVDFLHSNKNALTSIKIYTDTIPWLNKQEISKRNLESFLQDISVLSKNWDVLKKGSPIAIEETLYPLACKHLFARTPEEFEAQFPLDTDSIFKLDNTKVVRDSRRFCCTNGDGTTQLDFVFGNPTDVKGPREQLVSQTIYLKFFHLKGMQHLQVVWTAQALLDDLCGLVRWRDTRYTDIEDWVYYWHLISKKIEPVQGNIAADLLKNISLDGPRIVSELHKWIGEIKNTSPNPLKQIFSLLMNISLALPLRSESEVICWNIWNIFGGELKEISGPLRLLLPHLNTLSHPLLKMFMGLLSHRLLTAPQAVKAKAPVTVKILQETSATVELSLDDSCIRFPYTPVEDLTALAHGFELALRNGFPIPSPWLEHILREWGVQSSYDRKDSSVSSVPLNIRPADAAAIFKVPHPLLARLGYDLLIDRDQQLANEESAAALLTYFSLILFYEPDTTIRKTLLERNKKGVALLASAQGKEGLKKTLVKLAEEQPVPSPSTLSEWVSALVKGGHELLRNAAVEIWREYTPSQGPAVQTQWGFEQILRLGMRQRATALKFAQTLRTLGLGTCEEWKKCLTHLCHPPFSDLSQLYAVFDLIRWQQECYPSESHSFGGLVQASLDVLLQSKKPEEALSFLSVAAEKLLDCPQQLVEQAAKLKCNQPITPQQVAAELQTTKVEETVPPPAEEIEVKAEPQIDATTQLQDLRRQQKLFDELMQACSEGDCNELSKLLKIVDLANPDQVKRLKNFLESLLPALCSSSQKNGLSQAQRFSEDPQVKNLFGTDFASLAVKMLTEARKNPHAVARAEKIFALAASLLTQSSHATVVAEGVRLLQDLPGEKGNEQLRTLLNPQIPSLYDSLEEDDLLQLFEQFAAHIPLTEPRLTKLLNALAKNPVSSCLTTLFARNGAWTHSQTELLCNLYAPLIKLGSIAEAEKIASIASKSVQVTDESRVFWIGFARQLLTTGKHFTPFFTLLSAIHSHSKTENTRKDVILLLDEIPDAAIKAHPVDFARHLAAYEVSKKVAEKVRKYLKSLTGRHATVGTLHAALNFLDQAAYPRHLLWTELFQEIHRFGLELAKTDRNKACVLFEKARQIGEKRKGDPEQLARNMDLFNEWLQFEAARDLLLFALYALRQDPQDVEAILERFTCLENAVDPLNALFPTKPVRFIRLTRVLEGFCSIPFSANPPASLITRIATIRQIISSHVPTLKNRSGFDFKIAKILGSSATTTEFIQGFNCVLDSIVAMKPAEVTAETLELLFIFLDRCLILSSISRSMLIEDGMPWVPFVRKAVEYYREHLIDRIDPMRWMPVLLHSSELLEEAYNLAIHRLEHPPQMTTSSLHSPQREAAELYPRLVERLLQAKTYDSFSRAKTLMNHQRILRLVGANHVQALNHTLYIHACIWEFRVDGPLQKWAEELWATLLAIRTKYFKPRAENDPKNTKGEEWYKSYSEKLRLSSTNLTLRILQTACEDQLYTIITSSIYASVFPLAEINEMLESFFARAKTEFESAQIPQHPLSDPFVESGMFEEKTQLIKRLLDCHPSTNTLAWVLMHVLSSKLSTLLKEFSSKFTELVSLYNRFAFHPCGQTIHLNNDHLAAIAVLKAKAHNSLMGQFLKDSEPFYQISLYLHPDRKKFNHALKPSQEAKVIHQTIERLTNLGPSEALTRALQIRLDNQEFLQVSYRERIQWMQGICDQFKFDKPPNNETVRRVNWILIDLDKIQEELPPDHAVTEPLNRLKESAISAADRCLQFPGNFEQEVRRKLLANVMINLRPPLHLKKFSRWIPYIHSWNRSLLKSLEVELSAQTLLNCQASFSQIYAFMKHFYTEEYRTEALKLWEAIFEQLLQLKDHSNFRPQDLLVNHWIGRGAELNLFKGNYSLFISYLEKGMEYAFRTHPPRKDFELIPLAFMLFPQTHGLLPHNEAEIASHKKLVENYLKQLDPDDKIVVGRAVQDEQTPPYLKQMATAHHIDGHSIHSNAYQYFTGPRKYLNIP